jgi:two-component system chemotaxis response regulator CheB
VERDRTFSLSCDPPVLFSRPSIDVLLESCADAYGPELAGIVLTGANEDGARGLARHQGARRPDRRAGPGRGRPPTMPRPRSAPPPRFRPAAGGLRSLLHTVVR